MRYILLLVVLFLFGCASLERVSETENMMGTTVTITLLHENGDVAIDAIQSAFDAIAEVDSLMSSYDERSSLSILNRDGRLVDPDKELVFVLNRSLYYSSISDGAFDVTVKPLLDLYSNSFSEFGRPPSEDEIGEGLDNLGFGKVALSSDEVIIEDGMAITLGGIAKGYAIDKAIESLVEDGITHALVNAGGDIRALGEKEDGPWVLALQNPRDEDDFLAMLEVKDVSIATSGDYERYFDSDLSAHHIMDPRTGKSATSLMSVTIISPQAINADAMATTVFVLGPEEGMALIERFGNVEGLLITADREVIRSSGFGKYEQ